MFKEFDKEHVARTMPAIKPDQNEYNKIFVEIIEKIVRVLKSEKRLDTENVNVKKFEENIKKIIINNFVNKIVNKNPKINKDNALRFAKNYVEDNYYDYLRSQDATNIIELVSVEPPGLIENQLDF